MVQITGLFVAQGGNVSVSDIGARLKEERERLGVSQTRMGEIGSVGKTTQINYEKGVYSPDATYLAAIAAEGVDVLYVLTGARAQISEEGLNEREKAVLTNYRSLPEDDQLSVQRLTHALKETPNPLKDRLSKKNAG